MDYSGSKFGVFGVMETLEHMLWLRGDHGVRFTTCFPAWVPTKLADGIRYVIFCKYTSNIELL